MLKPKKKKPTAGRDVPLPTTLPKHLIPYDTNNDGVISEKENLQYRTDMMYKKLEQQAQAKEAREKKNKRNKRKKTNNKSNGSSALIVIK
tara:strand:+ start:652 stop:921 length:270 start_codon:yes stop_codon:yes gene_type:complete